MNLPILNLTAWILTHVMDVHYEFGFLFIFVLKKPKTLEGYSLKNSCIEMSIPHFQRLYTHTHPRSTLHAQLLVFVKHSLGESIILSLRMHHSVLISTLCRTVIKSSFGFCILRTVIQASSLYHLYL